MGLEGLDHPLGVGVAIEAAAEVGALDQLGLHSAPRGHVEGATASVREDDHDGQRIAEDRVE
jgi:hypothetical protein